MADEGRCVLTYNWGNSFKRYLQDGDTLRGKFGVAPTPGSTFVLDRETKELVDCDADRCRHGVYFEDIGLVNPSALHGFWRMGMRSEQLHRPTQEAYRNRVLCLC